MYKLLYFSIVIFIFAFYIFNFYPALAQVPTAGLVAHWAFDGLAADSVGTNNGTLVNGPTFTTGKIGQALSLDGVDDYVSVPESAGLDIRGSISISAWINRASSLANGEEEVIVRKDEGSSYLYNFRESFISGGGNFLTARKFACKRSGLHIVIIPTIHLAAVFITLQING